MNIFAIKLKASAKKVLEGKNGKKMEEGTFRGIFSWRKKKK